MLISDIPTRPNGGTIYASWFNDLRDSIIGSFGNGALLTIGANYTLASNDSVIELNSSLSTIDITVPTALPENKGKTFLFICSDITNTIRLLPTACNINGKTSFYFSQKYQGILIKSSGTEWLICSSTDSYLPIKYHGQPNDNDSFRLGDIGGDFVIQQRKAGIWEELINFGRR
jgi:hypothetical protein